MARGRRVAEESAVQFMQENKGGRRGCLTFAHREHDGLGCGGNAITAPEPPCGARGSARQRRGRGPSRRPFPLEFLINNEEFL